MRWLPKQHQTAMEKIVRKRSLREFRDRESPWKDRSYQERLAAMVVICGTEQTDERTEQGFPRIHRITRGKGS